MSKHTPGPWKFYKNEAHAPIQTDICVFSNNGNGGRVQGICRVDGALGGPEEQAANAALIANAPDLLSFLRKIVGLYECQQNATLFDVLGTEAGDVIAKAEGHLT